MHCILHSYTLVRSQALLCALLFCGFCFVVLMCAVVTRCTTVELRKIDSGAALYTRTIGKLPCGHSLTEPLSSVDCIRSLIRMHTVLAVFAVFAVFAV
jgi:hypothetical protein